MKLHKITVQLCTIKKSLEWLTGEILKFYIMQRTKLPSDTELMEISRNYCFGSISPTASIDLMICLPETRTCDCYAKNATWDPEMKICRMLPGSFCYKVNRVEIPCVYGASCIRGVCVCGDSEECLDHRIPIPDPGPRGDPSSLIIPDPYLPDV